MPDTKFTAQQAKVKHNAVQYVKPYNHLNVSLALDYAKNDYMGRKVYGLVQLAYKYNIPQSEIAKAMEVDHAVVSRKYPKEVK